MKTTSLAQTGKAAYLLTIIPKRGAKSIPDSEAKRQWTKENTSFIGLKLNHNTDADILAALEGKPKQTEVKRLLRVALQRETMLQCTDTPETLK